MANFLLSDREKSFLMTILFALIIVLVIITGIGYLIWRGMEKSGARLDDAVSDPLRTMVITDPKEFKKYAAKKNDQLFFRSAKWAVLIMLVGAIVLLIHESIVGFTFNPFSLEEGFGTIIPQFDWEQAEWATLWPIPINALTAFPPAKPYIGFIASAWSSYVFVPCLFVGAIWYFVAVTGYMSRLFRIKKLAKSVFAKSLENFNQNEAVMNAYGGINPIQPPLNNAGGVTIQPMDGKENPSNDGSN